MVCGKIITSLAEQWAQPIIRTCLRSIGKLCDDRPWCPNGITLCSNSLVFQLLKKIQQKTVRTTHNLPRYDKVKTLDKRQGFMTTVLYAEQNKGCYKFLWWLFPESSIRRGITQFLWLYRHSRMIEKMVGPIWGVGHLAAMLVSHTGGSFSSCCCCAAEEPPWPWLSRHSSSRSVQMSCRGLTPLVGWAPSPF